MGSMAKLIWGAFNKVKGRAAPARDKPPMRAPLSSPGGSAGGVNMLPTETMKTLYGEAGKEKT